MVSYYVFSKLLSTIKYNYKIYNKEMLVVIQALEEWRYFLENMTIPVEV